MPYAPYSIHVYPAPLIEVRVFASDHLTTAAPEPAQPAAHRSFGALQRALAELEQRLAEDAALSREHWLGQATSGAEQALLERAWAECAARRNNQPGA